MENFIELLKNLENNVSFYWDDDLVTWWTEDEYIEEVVKEYSITRNELCSILNMLCAYWQNGYSECQSEMDSE